MSATTSSMEHPLIERLKNGIITNDLLEVESVCILLEGMELVREMEKLVNADPSYRTILDNFLERGGTLATIIKQHGTCPGLKDIDIGPENPFILACSKGQKEIAEYLLQKSPSLLNKQDTTLLEYSIHYYPDNITLYLLTKDIVIDNIDNQGITPLSIAYVKGKKEIVQKLLQKGAKATPDFIEKATLNRDGELLSAIAEFRRADSKLTDEHQQLLKYNKKIAYLEKIGQVLGVAAKVKIPGAKGELTEKNTAGSSTIQSMKTLSESLKTYLTTLSDTTTPLYYQEIQKSLQEAIRRMQQGLPFDMEFKQYVENLQKNVNKLHIVPCGWKRHAFYVTLYKDKIVYCNRGRGSETEGDLPYTAIFDQNPEEIDTDFFKNATNNSIDSAERDVIFRNVIRAINQENPILFPNKTQGVANCSMANIKSSIIGYLYLLRKNDLENKLKTAVETNDEKVLAELRSIGIGNEADIEGIAMTFAKTEYKRFTIFMRDIIIDELINLYQRENDADEKAFYRDLIKEVIFVHHGNSRSPVKSEAEILRAVKMLNALSNEDRVIVLNDLKHKQLLPDGSIFEIYNNICDILAFSDSEKPEITEALKLLLKQSDFISETEKIQSLKLFYDHGKINLVKIMLESMKNSKAFALNRNPIMDNLDPIYYSILYRKTEGLQLFKNAAELSDADILNRFIKEDNIIAFRFLLENCHLTVNQKSKGLTPIQCAVQIGNLWMVQELQAAGADMTVKTENNQSLSQLAASNPEILEFLSSLTESKPKPAIAFALETKKAMDKHREEPSITRTPSTPTRNQ